MKKIMITAMAVAFAAATQAATVTWSGTKGALSAKNTTATDYTIVLIDAAVYSLATAQEDLAKGAFTYEANAVLRQTSGIAQTIASGTAAGDYFRFTETNQAQLGGAKTYDKGDAVTAYAIVFNDAIADATEAMITKSVSQTVNNSSLASLPIGDLTATGAISSTWTAINVPEPTSGLLLLLGMAGLALRRRRA